MSNDDDTLLESYRYFCEINSHGYMDSNSVDLEMEDVSVDQPTQLYGKDINQPINDSIIYDWKNLYDIDDSQNQNIISQNEKTNICPVDDDFKHENHFAKIDSCTESSQNSINDFVTMYNKIIQLLDDEILVKDNFRHNFHLCNVCSNYYMQVSEDYYKTLSLIDAINSVGYHKNSVEIAELYSSIVTELKFSIKDKNKSKYENGIVEENASFSSNTITQNSLSSMKFSEIDTFSELAKIKLEKSISCLKHLAKLHNVINNILNDGREYDSITREEMDFGKKEPYIGNYRDIMELDYEILSFLMIYLQDFSCNKRGVLVNIYEKVNVMEQSMVTEFLLFIKQFVESIKTNEPTLVEIPDFSALKLLCEEISSTAHSLGISKSDNYYLNADFDHCNRDTQHHIVSPIKESKELNDLTETSDSRRTTAIDGSLDFIIDSDSSGTPSEESYVDLIVDCENELIKIPSKKCFFLAYSGLKKSNIKQLYKLAFRMKFGITKEYIQDTTTHLIIPENWQTKTFTYQYLAAIAYQSHIVTFKWVEDCLKADRIMPTKIYIPNLPGALSCLNKNRKLLFEDYSFYVYSTEELQIKEQNQHLAEACGAAVLTDILHLYGSRCRSNRKVLISDRSPNPELLLQCINLGIYPVHSSWMHDSIIKYAVQPLELYSLINRSETNIELATGAF